MDACYLDCNATTPLDPRVLEAMRPWLTHAGNPSSLHGAGRRARAAIEQAREQVAALVGVDPVQVVFTSGGTEANNLALHALCARAGTGTLAVSAIEHPSVQAPARQLAARGWRLQPVPCDAHGQVRLEALAEALEPEGGVATVMLANNETGVVQDVTALAAEARGRGALFHTDAVQAAGKLALDFTALGVTSLSLSAHKFHGPKGVGALVVERGFPVAPLLAGGGQERGRRSGTENLAGIVGFGRAAELARAERAQRADHMLALRQRLEAGLARLPGISIFAEDVPRLPNTVQFALAGYQGEALLMELDREGIAVSSGSACASGAGRPSPVLVAMGVDPDLARGAVRVSLGPDNRAEDVDRLLHALEARAAGARRLGALGW